MSFEEACRCPAKCPQLCDDCADVDGDGRGNAPNNLEIAISGVVQGVLPPLGIPGVLRMFSACGHCTDVNDTFVAAFDSDCQWIYSFDGDLCTPNTALTRIRAYIDREWDASYPAWKYFRRVVAEELTPPNPPYWPDGQWVAVAAWESVVWVTNPCCLIDDDFVPTNTPLPYDPWWSAKLYCDNSASTCHVLAFD